MAKVIAINGSPQMEKGNTAVVLAPFVQGMTDAGAEVEVVHAKRLKVKPCGCGEMRCWYATPGECLIQDDMQTLYAKLREASILVLPGHPCLHPAARRDAERHQPALPAGGAFP